MKLHKIALSAVLLAAMAAPMAFADDHMMDGEHHGKKMEHQMKADTDADGFVSKAEFIAAQEKRFAELDADSDGKVSKDEMKNHRKEMKEKWKDKKAEHKEKRKEKSEEKAGE